MKVSVVVCTFNGEKYLNEQLDSILNQSVPVDEIIVCDDCSTDGTLEILNSYVSEFPDLFRVFRNPMTLRTIKNFEKAISLSSGDLIFLADQDDFWDLDKVRVMKKIMEMDTSCLMLFTNGSLVDQDSNGLGGTIFEKWGFDKEEQLKWKDNFYALRCIVNSINKVTGATACFRSQLKEEIIPIQTPCCFWHDAWIAMHAAKYNGLRFLDQCLIHYRIHTNQQVGIQNGVTMEWQNNDCEERVREFDEYLRENFREIHKYYHNRKRNILEKVIGKLTKLVK